MSDRTSKFPGASGVRQSRRDFVGLGGLMAGSIYANASQRTLGAPAGDHPIVCTAAGKVRGVRDGSIASFKGIPYGADTGGANRFRVPQPVRPWRGVRDALTYGNQAPQILDAPPAWQDPSPMSEDCLALNVWTPAPGDRSAALPVLVWVHAGAFILGSAGAQLYDGTNLSKFGDVVVVSANHRLGLFGYSQFDVPADSPYAYSGNAAQLDLIAALHWVRTNIRDFGGDPGSVTLFGESGGGGKITALLAMPGAQGLFHKATVQSGSNINFRQTSEAIAMSELIFSKLGVARNDFAALQMVPMQRLIDVGQQCMADFKSGLPPYFNYRPVADDRIVEPGAWVNAAPAVSSNVPLIVGTTLHDGVIMLGKEWGTSVPDDDYLARKVAEYSVNRTLRPDQIAPLIPKYRQAMPQLSSPELLVRIVTDVTFWGTAVTQAELRAEQGVAPVYMFRCDWRTPVFGGSWAVHGVDLPLIFDNKHIPSAWDGEDCDAKRAAADPQNDWDRTRDAMLSAWIAFARTGNPSTPGLAWPAYGKFDRSTAIFDAHSRIENDPQAEVRAAVVELFRSVQTHDDSAV